MPRRPQSDVEGQTNRTLEEWGKTHPAGRAPAPPPPRDFRIKPMLCIIGMMALLVVVVIFWQSHQETRRKEEEAALAAERTKAAQVRLAREQREERKRRAAEARRRAAQEAREEKARLKKQRAELAARLKQVREAAESARRAQELPETQTAEEVRRPVHVTATATLSEMQRGLEVLNKRDDPYAVYALAQCYYRKCDDPDVSSLAKESMAAAGHALQKARARFPELRASEPISMDRVVTKDGAETVGRIVGRSPTAVLVELPLSKADTPRRKALRHENIKQIGKVDVAPERLNRCCLERLGRGFVSGGRARRHSTVLACWGRLCCEFPDENPTAVVGTALEGQSQQEVDAEVTGFLTDAASWASHVCPKCLGERTIACSKCKGKGKVTVEVVCPRCKGKKQDCPICPTPHPWETTGPVQAREEPGPGVRVSPPPGYRYRGIPGTVRCPACNGTGRKAAKSYGPFRTRGGCARCGGTGEKRCPNHCKDGVVVCTRCGNKGKVTAKKNCLGCEGKKGVTCPVCGGSGLRHSQPPGPGAPLMKGRDPKGR